MKFTAQQIAEALGGSLEGNPEVQVDNLAKIEEGVPGALSFLSNPKYEPYIYTTKASVVIVNDDFKPAEEVTTTLIRVPDAYASFAQILEMYNEYQVKSRVGIASMTSIDETAEIAEDVYIGEMTYVGKNVKIGKGSKIYPQVYLGDYVEVGENTVLFPGVKIYHQCQIGANCILHAGAVIGADGFGFAPTETGEYKKIAQIGNVVIEDNVEIGANTTIDRATMGSTIIHKGVKIDNLIQIAHNVEIGDHTVMAAQSGVSGSTKIGKHVTIAGQVGIVGHITIADKAILAAQTGLSNSVKKDGQIMMGTPAMDAKRFKTSFVHFRNLDKLEKRVRELEEKLSSKD